MNTHHLSVVPAVAGAPRAVLVSRAHDRMKFWPELFGGFYAAAESSVYGWMSANCQGYEGGYWEYFSLNGGSGFAVPGFEGKKIVRIRGNQFCGEVSAEAAGILATVFVFDRFIWQTSEKPELEPLFKALCERKVKLMDYAETTKEAGAIFRVLD
ncbi:antirestriction protein [Candidatus Pantoea multigeneris]|nr:antirestriction protein [Pantoea multigeneris]